MAANRRIFPRVHLFKFFVEAALKDEKKYTGVEIVNISAGGLCFLSKFIVSPGDEFTFRFPLKRGDIILPGKAVRINGREVGIRFTCDHDTIADFVDAYNEELHALTINKKEESRLILPGHEKDRISDSDDFLDIGPEKLH